MALNEMASRYPSSGNGPGIDGPPKGRDLQFVKGFDGLGSGIWIEGARFAVA